MKKFIYMLAGLVLSAAFSSCEDAKEPVLEKPTEFVLNTPTLADELLATTGDSEDKSTFNLFCSQPNYGVSVVANYGVEVSLNKDFTEGPTPEQPGYVALTNSNSSSAAMTFRTYDLAVATTKLLKITDKEMWNAYVAAGNPLEVPVYFRATCEVPGVPESKIVSNVVSYNKVQLNYAIPTKGFIWVLGQVANPVTGNWNNFMEPAEANASRYNDFRLFEPEIGCKLYAGTFIMKTCSGNESAGNGCLFRFTKALKGWNDGSVMIGTQAADGNVYVGDQFVDGLYKATAVFGKGNWSVWNTTENGEITLVVSLEDKNTPKVWFKMGRWDVQVQLDANNKREPKFVTPAN